MDIANNYVPREFGHVDKDTKVFAVIATNCLHVIGTRISWQCGEVLRDFLLTFTRKSRQASSEEAKWTCSCCRGFSDSSNATMQHEVCKQSWEGRGRTGKALALCPS
eukprot:582470-Amphidinium_carterae.1